MAGTGGHEPLDVDEAQARLDELGEHIRDAERELLEVDDDGETSYHAPPLLGDDVPDAGGNTGEDDAASDSDAQVPG